MECQKIFDIIDALNEEYISVWADACNIESPTNDKAGVDEVGAYFARLAEKKGMAVDIYPIEGSGDIVTVTMNPNAPGEPVFLSGHTDTVHPKGLFGYPPVKIEGDKIYGPGVTDCKGGVAVAFLAMKALKEIGFTDRPVKLFLQSDEENSSATSNKKTVRQMCECAEGAECFLNLEGCHKGKAVIGRKGIVRYEIKVHGKAIHSARCAYGANAVAEAAHKIIELEKMKDAEGLTCNCVIKYGGDAPNSVPELCIFSADIRFATSEELEEARKTVARVCEKNYVDGCTTEVRELSFRPPMERRETNYELLDRMNDVFEKCSLPTLEPIFVNGGSDAAYVTEAGIPCVDSLGANGDFVHSTREMVLLSSVAEAAKRVASVILYL